MRAPLATCCATLSAALVLAMTGTTLATGATAAAAPTATAPARPSALPGLLVATTAATAPPCCGLPAQPRAATTVPHRPAP